MKAANHAKGGVDVGILVEVMDVSTVRKLAAKLVAKGLISSTKHETMGAKGAKPITKGLRALKARSIVLSFAERELLAHMKRSIEILEKENPLPLAWTN